VGKKSGSVRKWCINLSLFFISAIIAVLALEAALRSTSHRHSLQGTRYPRGYFTADYTSGYDIAPGNLVTFKYSLDHSEEIWSNEMGCFDSPYGGEDEYVLLVGDSFAWGFSPFEGKWGTLVERHLNRRVLKCGVPGYGTKHALIKAKKTTEKAGSSPGLILLGYWMGDDMENDYRFPANTVLDGYLLAKAGFNRETGEKFFHAEENMREGLRTWQQYCTSNVENLNRPIQRIKCWLERNSVLYNTTKRPVGNALLKIPFLKELSIKTGVVVYVEYEHLVFKTPEEFPWLERAWEEHLGNLEDMEKLAREYGAELLVVLIPTKEQVYDFLKAQIRGDTELPNRIVGGFLEEKNIDHLDLTPLFREYADQRPEGRLDNEDDLYWYRDFHLNLKGNRLAGLLVARHVLKEGMLDLPRRDRKLKAVEEALAGFK
jgi:hypothetical protein